MLKTSKIWLWSIIGIAAGCSIGFGVGYGVDWNPTPTLSNDEYSISPKTLTSDEIKHFVWREVFGFKNNYYSIDTFEITFGYANGYYVDSALPTISMKSGLFDYTDYQSEYHNAIRIGATTGLDFTMTGTNSIDSTKTISITKGTLYGLFTEGGDYETYDLYSCLLYGMDIDFFDNDILTTSLKNSSLFGAQDTSTKNGYDISVFIDSENNTYSSFNLGSSTYYPNSDSVWKTLLYNNQYDSTTLNGWSQWYSIARNNENSLNVDLGNVEVVVPYIDLSYFY